MPAPIELKARALGQRRAGRSEARSSAGDGGHPPAARHKLSETANVPSNELAQHDNVAVILALVHIPTAGGLSISRHGPAALSPKECAAGPPGSGKPFAFTPCQLKFSLVLILHATALCRTDQRRFSTGGRQDQGLVPCLLTSGVIALVPVTFVGRSGTLANAHIWLRRCVTSILGQETPRRVAQQFPELTARRAGSITVTTSPASSNGRTAPFEGVNRGSSP